MTKEEAMQKAESEKINEAYDLIKNRKESEKVADIYFTAQLENKKKQLEELNGKIAFLQNKHDTLAETITKEHRERLASIDQRNIEAENKHNKAQAILEDAKRELNFVEQEKSNVIGKRQELNALISEYNEKKGILMRFVDTIK